MTREKALVRTSHGPQLQDWIRYAEYSPGRPEERSRKSPRYPRFRYVLGGKLRDPGARLFPPPVIPGSLCWIGLNPSTATHLGDDPTVRRIQRFTLAAGYAHYEIVNLFAYRSRHPEELAITQDPVGPQNHALVAQTVHRADRVICAWGAVPDSAIREQRAAEIRWLYRLLTDPPSVNTACFGFTASGAPRHPLFLRKTAPLLAMSWDWIPDEWRQTA